MVPFKPKKRDHGVNVARSNPLKDFAKLIVLVAGSIAFIMLIFIGFGKLVGTYVSPEQEVRWVEKLWAGAEPNNKKLDHLMNELWKPFSGPKHIPLKLQVIELKEENAFMAPGGNSFLSKTLIKNSKSENSLAFVICHEIGHFYHRDVTKGVSSALAFAFAESMLSMTGTSLGFSNSFGNILQLQFSQRQERQADAFAIDCLHQHYGHVNGYDEFFRRARSRESNSFGSQFFRSHPLSEKRIEALKELAQTKGYQLDGALTPNKFLEGL